MKVWPLIRIHLYFSLFAHHHVKVTTRPRRNKYVAAVNNIVTDIFKFAYANYKDEKKCAALKESDVLFLSDGISFASVDGYWYEKFCDPLISALSDKELSSLLITPSSRYLVPRNTSSKFIQPGLSLAKIQGVLHSKLKPALRCDLPEFQEFINFVNDADVGISVPNLDELTRLISCLNQYVIYYDKILDNVRPQIAGIVCYYNIEGLAFCLACRKNDIPCFDLQHGLQGPLHVAYGRWNKVPQDGYEMLPSLFWCWSESEASAIRQWSHAADSYHHPIVGGNPWLNLWKRNASELTTKYDKIITNSSKMGWQQKRVIISLQFGVDDKETLQPILDTVAGSDSSYFWWIRLHPCMLEKRSVVKEMFDTCGNTNINIDEATDLPLYALLRHADLHVTHSSSTVIEAESFGVPSIITSEYGAEFFPDQIASGWAVLALKKDVIYEAIARQIQRYPKRPVVDDINESPAMEYMVEVAKNKRKVMKCQ